MISLLGFVTITLLSQQGVVQKEQVFFHLQIIKLRFTVTNGSNMPYIMHETLKHASFCWRPFWRMFQSLSSSAPKSLLNLPTYIQ